MSISNLLTENNYELYANKAVVNVGQISSLFTDSISTIESNPYLTVTSRVGSLSTITNTSVSTTFSVPNFLNGICYVNGAGGITLTLPNAAAIISAIGAYVFVGQRFSFKVVNSSAGSVTIPSQTGFASFQSILPATVTTGTTFNLTIVLTNITVGSEAVALYP